MPCPTFSIDSTPTIIALLEYVADGGGHLESAAVTTVAVLSMTFVAPAGVISHRACARVQPTDGLPLQAQVRREVAMTSR